MQLAKTKFSKGDLTMNMKEFILKLFDTAAASGIFNPMTIVYEAKTYAENSQKKLFKDRKTQ